MMLGDNQAFITRSCKINLAYSSVNYLYNILAYLILKLLLFSLSSSSSQQMYPGWLFSIHCHVLYSYWPNPILFLRQFLLYLAYIRNYSLLLFFISSKYFLYSLQHGMLANLSDFYLDLQKLEAITSQKYSNIFFSYELKVSLTPR